MLLAACGDDTSSGGSGGSGGAQGGGGGSGGEATGAGGSGGENAGGDSEGGGGAEVGGAGGSGGEGGSAPVCGDGAIGGEEACDDTNNVAGDGCSEACAVEDGWTCDGEPSVCTTPTLVAVTEDGDFYRVNVGDGSATLVGETGFTSLWSLAANANGELFTAESQSGAGARRLIQINPLTGEGTVVVTLTNAATLDFRSLAFSTAGVLYGVNHSNDSLYTIDMATGAATLIGDTGLTNLEGLDFTSAGQLYAWNATSGLLAQQAGLNTLDPATGASTDVNLADMGTQQAVFSIATVPGDATFIGIGGSTLYSIDRLNGAAPEIVDHDVPNPRGIEIISLPALPAEQ